MHNKLVLRINDPHWDAGPQSNSGGFWSVEEEGSLLRLLEQSLVKAENSENGIYQLVNTTHNIARKLNRTPHAIYCRLKKIVKDENNFVNFSVDILHMEPEVIEIIFHRKVKSNEVCGLPQAVSNAHDSSQFSKEFVDEIIKLNTVIKRTQRDDQLDAYRFNMINLAFSTDNMKELQMPQVIQNITLIEGQDVDKVSEDTLISLIHQLNSKKKSLESTAVESKRIKEKIAEIDEALKVVIDRLDTRKW